MLCALDQSRLEHYSLSSLSRSPSSITPPRLHDNFDLLTMQSLPSSPSENSYSIKDSGYFSNTTISPSGRQRTAQACDKCRERKTKCSGEKPVCQRCTSRGLICEYSYREPRVRGPARARIVPSTTSSRAKDPPSKPYPTPLRPRQDTSYSRPHVSHRNHQPPEYSMDSTYSTNSVALTHNSFSSYLGAESRSYSEPRAVHLPHWANVRQNSNNYASSNMGLMSYGSPQIQISATAREANSCAMGYDPYSTMRQPIKGQESLLNCAPNSSSFLLEAQQSPRYNANDLHYDYRAGNAILESPLSSSPDGGYQSSSTVSSSTPTPPFYPLDHLEHPSMGSHSRPMANEYNGEAFGKRELYAEDGGTGFVPDYSYTKKFGIREDWPCVESDSSKLFSMGDAAVHVGGRNDQNAKLNSALWSNDVPQMSQLELEFRCQSAHRESFH